MTDFKGSILEIKENHAIVMTDVCDFVVIKRKPGMFVGQQIIFRKSDINSTKRNYIKYYALAASIFLIALSCTFYFRLFVPSTVYAYIDVDINPSLEFSINQKAQVLDIKPLNGDAQVLIKDLKLVDLPVKQAITEVVKESKKLGFIKPNVKNAVLISASINAAKGYKPNKSGEKVLDNILTDINSATFDLGTEKIKPEVLKVTPEYRNLAIKNEISMGRYALYNKLKEEGVNITIEEAKTSRVSDMLDKTHIDSTNGFTPETTNNVNQNNFKSNGDETQVDKTKGNNNTGISSKNAEEKTNKNENKQNMKQDKNGTLDNLNGNTRQGNTQSQSNKAGDNSNSGAGKDNSGSNGQGNTQSQSNKAG
ncbi:MAG: anti-sigma factor domain-containing protein, partial [Clostridiales bacterium]|nr:anti-sigma factor domain-containing protein [Clostridiales bacterium]